MNYVKFVLILFVLFFVGCFQAKEEQSEFRAHQVVAAIDFCCHNNRADLGYKLYQTEISDIPSLKSLLDRRQAMKLFSTMGQKEDYFISLNEFIQRRGKDSSVVIETDNAFYESHKKEIQLVIKKNQNFSNQHVNQLGIKSLLLDTFTVDYGLVQSMNILLRHAAPEYLKEFKNSGLSLQ